MAGDFFRRQDRARSQTFRLILAFTFWLVFTVALIVALIAFAMPFGGDEEAVEPTLAVMDQGLALGLGLMIVGMGGALMRYLALRHGADAVVAGMGGRRIVEQMADGRERVLLNVVTEMAIASGMPVPSIWVIDRAKGINAFAIGWSLEDAAIAVTPEALAQFDRDELQGVIAHEFSHLVNGDTTINVRLICAIAGITAIASLGQRIMNARGDNKKEAVFIGLVIFLLGSLGVVVARALQAGISRQREKLADASAVQYTRNPAGLRKALMRIGGYIDEGRVGDSSYAEVAHCFFASAFNPKLPSRWFATHPPIEERIAALGGPAPRIAVSAGHAETGDPRLSGFSDPVATMGEVVMPAAEVELHPALLAATASPLDALASCLALIDAKPEAVAAAGIEGLAPAVASATHRQFALKLEKQLELIDRCGPGLGQLSDRQAAAAWALMNQRFIADDSLSPIGAALLTIGQRRLHRRTKKTPKRIADEVVLLLSAAAHAAQRGEGFELGLDRLPVSMRGAGKLRPAEACHTTAVARALQRMASTAPSQRWELCHAIVAVVRADDRVSVEEMALLRCFFASMALPMPRVQDLT